MKKIFGLIIGVASLMVSCSSSDGPDQPPLPPTDDIVTLLGDEIKAYVNGAPYNLTRAAFGEGEIYLQGEQLPDGYQYPGPVQGNESNYVEDYLGKNSDNYYEGEVPASYYMYACKGTNSGKVEGFYINDMLTGFHIDNNGHKALVLNVPIESAAYTYKTNNNQVVKVTDKWRLYQIEFHGRTGLYLAFDAEYEKNGKYKGFDGKYDDYIVKIIDTTSPEDPKKQISAGLIEINWAVNQQRNEKGVETNYSKCSIHVRDTTDIQVVLPIKAEYQCESDDFAIVAKHDVEVAYNQANTSVTYDFGGNIVTLYVKHYEDRVEITSDGINANVLKYLRNTYGDGVTFEVWTWMGTYPTDITDGMATIESLTSTPLYFLNTMNDGSQSHDLEFAKPAGYNDPEVVTFEGGSTHYRTQIYERLDSATE